MRETQSGRTKGTTSRGVAMATLVSFLFVVLGWMLVVPAPATADVAISDKLSLFGDFRARYEIDDQDRAGTTDRDRDRARLRARFGFKHKSTDKISFGMRLATEAGTLQSPHQNLDTTAMASDDADFGLDRAYVDVKWGKSGFAWFGKHGVSFWEQNEQFWDGDIQPEGVGAGYKFGLASGASVLLQSTFAYLNEENWGDNDGAIGDDDFGATLQAVYNKGPLTAAVGSLFVGENGDGVPNFQGGSATYTIASIQYKIKAQVPLKLGFDWLHGENVVDNSAANYVTGGSTDETGYVVNASTKIGKWGFQFKHHYVPVNSVPLQGQLSQDNFPFSSNFEGQRYQVGYNFGNGIKADVRLYDQDILAGTSAGCGAQCWVMNVDGVTRVQGNLNLKF